MLQAKESQNIEYKSSWHDEYLKWICGFANAQGAVMYIGVNDNLEVCGLQHTKKLLEDIPNKVVNSMGIVVDVNLKEQDGLEYLEIIISPSNIPISYKGKYYYRSGSTMQELNGAALQQFILKKMGRSWDDIPNDYATIKDLDRSAIKYFIDNAIAAERIDRNEAKASTQRVLENMGLITEDHKLKNAALLLFAKNPRKFFTCVEFKIGRFRHDESDLIIQDVIEGNIIQMTDRVVEVLKAKYLTSPIHYEGMKRREPLEIPEDALREILYNAIAHKDYTGAPIQMRIWDDYIEIWNEGELPSGYTPETLMRKHSSRPRNKNIANAFFKAGFIESWGRGYEKIRHSFANVGLPAPIIESLDGGVKVTFKRSNRETNQESNRKSSQESSQKSSQESNQKTNQESRQKSRQKSSAKKIIDDTPRDSTNNEGLAQQSNTKSGTKSGTKSNTKSGTKSNQKRGANSERVVISAIIGNSHITLADLMTITGLSMAGVKKVIDRLKMKHYIQRIGPDKGGYWQIIDNTNNDNN